MFLKGSEERACAVHELQGGRHPRQRTRREAQQRMGLEELGRSPIWCLIRLERDPEVRSWAF